MASLENMEKERDLLKKEMLKIGDMRRGSVTEQFLAVKQKGKKAPVLRGPYYTYTRKEGGKTIGFRLNEKAELEKYRRETGNFRKFQEISRELIETNEKICDLKPTVKENETDEIKKKLQKASKKR